MQGGGSQGGGSLPVALAFVVAGFATITDLQVHSAQGHAESRATSLDLGSVGGEMEAQEGEVGCLRSSKWVRTELSWAPLCWVPG